jgi:hypothetical protein
VHLLDLNQIVVARNQVLYSTAIVSNMPCGTLSPPSHLLAASRSPLRCRCLSLPLGAGFWIELPAALDC